MLSPTRAVWQRRRMPLSSKDTQHLRALGHALRPLVQVGKGGVTPALVRATQQALNDHELIKVRVGTEAPDERRESAQTLAEGAGASLVQVVGRTFLLYRPHPQGSALRLGAPGRPNAKRAHA